MVLIVLCLDVEFVRLLHLMYVFISKIKFGLLSGRQLVNSSSLGLRYVLVGNIFSSNSQLLIRAVYNELFKGIIEQGPPNK